MAQQQRQRKTNGQSASNSGGARNELQLKDRIVSGADGVPVLDHVNLGQGNYSEDDYWQQIRSYRRGLYLHTAFQRTIFKRAVHETIVALGREGYNAHYDEVAEDVAMHEPADPTPLDELDVDEMTAADGRRQQVFDRGKEIWDKLGEPNVNLSKKQAAALLEKTDVKTSWLPISWEMVLGRHEASRSRDAELIRDVFTNVSDLRAGDNDSDQLNKLLRRNKS